MIEVQELTKRYGSTLAVDALSFDLRPGTVTGFLGANGSGKSTTMRLILGLDSPDAGRVRIGGQRFRDLRWPLREAGSLLEARAFHPGRSARSHLAALAASNAIPLRRVDEVLDLVGLTIPKLHASPHTFQSEQDNEYFLHHRRSGRDPCDRKLSRTARLKHLFRFAS